ncbi:MAG: UDP-N-acetylmuramate dehydrogenase [Oscillibacter sp.]|nr:UDP-N-acetylmuramate dehydrogenase [Oscillibacter sp.]
MDWVTEFDRRVLEFPQTIKIVSEEPMSRHTSFRIGGPAKRMAFPKDTGELAVLLNLGQDCGARPLVIGNGTNLLAPDEGLDRLVIETSGVSLLEMGSEPNDVTAACGVPLARLADFACKQGLSGLEFAHGIPGTAGGAVCMNAGAYGGEMKQVLIGASVLFPGEKPRFLWVEDLHLGYRRSLLTEHPEAVVFAANFRLTPGDPGEIREKMRDLMQRRRASQPLELPSAGSTFKRPEGYFAGTLIDQCGLKGLTVGGAQVSEKHAGFIVNRGGATCADVRELIRQVQERVFAQTGVRLEPEVRFVQ